MTPDALTFHVHAGVTLTLKRTTGSRASEHSDSRGILRLLERGIVTLYSGLGELRTRHHRIFLQRPLDFAVAVGVVEEGQAVSLAIVIDGGVSGRLDPVESTLETIIRPGHQEIPAVQNPESRQPTRMSRCSHVADNLPLHRANLCPLVPQPKFGKYLPPRTYLQPALPWPLE